VRGEDFSRNKSRVELSNSVFTRRDFIDVSTENFCLAGEEALDDFYRSPMSQATGNGGSSIRYERSVEPIDIEGQPDGPGQSFYACEQGFPARMSLGWAEQVARIECLDAIIGRGEFRFIAAKRTNTNLQ